MIYFCNVTKVTEKKKKIEVSDSSTTIIGKNHYNSVYCRKISEKG